MTSDIQTETWSKRRWRTVIGILFVLQLSLIFFFGTKQMPRPRTPPAKTALKIVPGTVRQQELAEFLKVEDPTLFALPNAHGFSGPAWLHQPTFRFEMTNWTETPQWLQLEAASLGEGLRFEPGTNLLAPASIHGESPIEPLSRPQLLGNKPVHGSKLSMDKELNGRWSGAMVELKAQPWTDVLQSTQVQVGIDPEGKVVSAGIWRSSGSRLADAEALRTAKSLIFDPVRPTQGRQSSNELTWGKLTFQWFTVPVQK